MESPRNIPLNDLSNYLGNNDTSEPDAVYSLRGQTSHHEFSPPPADGGRAAWLFLAAEFVVEALVWGQFNRQCCQSNRLQLRSIRMLNCNNVCAGFPFSFGIFQEYYITNEPFYSAPSGVTVIGITATVGHFPVF
jgi:hypothetical protein